MPQGQRRRRSLSVSSVDLNIKFKHLGQKVHSSGESAGRAEPRCKILSFDGYPQPFYEAKHRVSSGDHQDSSDELQLIEISLPETIQQAARNDLFLALECYEIRSDDWTADQRRERRSHRLEFKRSKVLS